MNFLLPFLLSSPALQTRAPAPAGQEHAGGASLASEKRTEKLAELQAALEGLMEQVHLPGMSAALVHRRALAWKKGFGYADLENEVWAEPDTRYRLASVSKTFAAVLVMQLVEQGKLSLDAPMKDFHLYKWFAPDPKRYQEQPVLLARGPAGLGPRGKPGGGRAGPGLGC